MITKEKISDGLDIGTVYLAVDPNMESGTVCFIGDLWFGRICSECAEAGYRQRNLHGTGRL